MTPVLAVGDWRLQGTPRPYQYISPDGTTFLSAGQDFVSGAMSWGTKSADLLRSFGLSTAIPGKPFYLTDEADARTWSATVAPDGSLSDLKLFAEQGGEGVTVDDQGNVYIAAGQIYVYNSAGHWIDTIEVPERPLQVVFGGSDRRTLFIPARTSLYAVRTNTRGR
jgi:sugar lactone lactonase YvrE